MTGAPQPPAPLVSLVERARLYHPGSPMRRVVVRMEPREIARLDALRVHFPRTPGKRVKGSYVSRASLLRAFVLYSVLMVEGALVAPPATPEAAP